jgi:hypothetical protein
LLTQRSKRNNVIHYIPTASRCDPRARYRSIERRSVHRGCRRTGRRVGRDRLACAERPYQPASGCWRPSPQAATGSTNSPATCARRKAG